MNSMVMLKNALLSKNRTIVNVMLRKMDADIGGLVSDAVPAPFEEDDLFVLMENSIGDQFWFRTVVSSDIDEKDGLPVFCRNDILKLKGML